MNIDAISSSYQSQMEQATAMTDEQKEEVSSILENYDLENLSEEDRMSIRSDLNDAGIKPSRELFETMEASGMEMQKPDGPPPGGGKGGPKGPPPGGASGVESAFSSESTQETFLSLIESLEEGEIDEEDFIAQIQDLLDEEETTSLFDITI